MFHHSAQCWDIATCAMPKLNPPPKKKIHFFPLKIYILISISSEIQFILMILGQQLYN
jgi:hypothetical protein